MDAAFRSAGQHPMWALVTQSSQTQWFEPDTSGDLSLRNSLPSSRNEYKLERALGAPVAPRTGPMSCLLGDGLGDFTNYYSKPLKNLDMWRTPLPPASRLTARFDMGVTTPRGAVDRRL